MSANQAVFPIATMARVLGVSTAGYYAWRARPPSARCHADDALLKRIRTIHATSHETYGAPRVHAELRARRPSSRAQADCPADADGGHRRRQPPPRHRDDAARHRTPGRRPTWWTATSRPSGPNQLWVADITFIPTAAGFLYLAVVLDAFSRRIVGWSMANHLRTELVLEALDMAIGQRKPTAVIHHSDQGSQYTSLAFGGRCREAGRAAVDGLGRRRL